MSGATTHERKKGTIITKWKQKEEQVIGLESKPSD